MIMIMAMIMYFFRKSIGSSLSEILLSLSDSQFTKIFFPNRTYSDYDNDNAIFQIFG
jgi:hypothetical protein